MTTIIVLIVIGYAVYNTYESRKKRKTFQKIEYHLANIEELLRKK